MKSKESVSNKPKKDTAKKATVKQSKSKKSKEQKFCSTHKKGPFNIDSIPLKNHLEETQEKCKLVKYNPKRHNPEYKESKISNDTNPKDSRSQSRILYDFAMSKIIKLYISDNNRDEVYALVPVNNHTELLELSSIRAIQWLTNLYSENIDNDDLYGEDFYKKVIHTIKSQCQMNDTQRVQIYRRIAQLDDSIWYDLGTEKWDAVKITKKGIKRVSLGKDSPMFSRTQSTYKQVDPIYEENSNALNELADLCRIKPEDKTVFIPHVVSFFLEAIPIPIMVFSGTAGSVKTTATGTIKILVDPSGKKIDDNVANKSPKPDDLILQLSNRYLSSFDNLGYIDEEESNILCRTITGSSNTKRKLYTDGSEFILNFMRKVVLNGVIPTLEYPDLQTRILSYERIPIEDENKFTTIQFRKILDELIPRVLGQIFTVLSSTLRDFTKLSKTIKPKTRLADFEVWCEIISQKLGFDKNQFLDRYYEKRKEETIKSQDAYPIISSIQSLMKDKDVYENSASELYSVLCDIAENSGINIKDRYIKFPKGSNKLVRDLKIVESNLKTVGFDIETYYYTKRDNRFTLNSSVIKISKKQAQKTLSQELQKEHLAPLAESNKDKKPKNQEQNKERRAKGTVRKARGKKEPLANDTSNSANFTREIQDDNQAKEASGTLTDISHSKPTVIKNLEQAKQDLRRSGFEIWIEGK